VAAWRHTCGINCNSCGGLNPIVSQLQTDPVALLFLEMQHLSDAMRNGTLLANSNSKQERQSSECKWEAPLASSPIRYLRVTSAA
jgi:hypothetical protein